MRGAEGYCAGLLAGVEDGSGEGLGGGGLEGAERDVGGLLGSRTDDRDGHFGGGAGVGADDVVGYGGVERGARDLSSVALTTRARAHTRELR